MGWQHALMPSMSGLWTRHTDGSWASVRPMVQGDLVESLFGKVDLPCILLIVKKRPIPRWLPALVQFALAAGYRVTEDVHKFELERCNLLVRN
jgi:hypothetical protein